MCAQGQRQGACCQGDPCISQGSGLLRSIAAVLRVYNLCTAAAVCLMHNEADETGLDSLLTRPPPLQAADGAQNLQA